MGRPYSIYNTISATDANAPILQGLAVTGTNTYYSQMFSGATEPGYGLQVIFAGTPTGTFTLWFSNKDKPDETNDNDWVQDTTFVPTNPAGAGGKFWDDAVNANAFRKRLKYVNASGAGTVSAFVSTAASST